MKNFFTIKLFEWHNLHNKRTMPWKGEKDPYKIWLSEIILQQTRVEQGIAYYNKFVQTYPHIINLAAAADESVFKIWEGLGYYNRCKNLLITARQIATEHAGKFPTNYDDIIKLKGVGPYTAAAIASFAYNLPYAVVDGNVFRLLSRYFGFKLPIDTIEGKRTYSELAQELLNKKKPALYNQAIMDFGATVCKPQIPLCKNCVFNKHCIAFKNGWVNELPVKEKLLLKKDRWMYYFVFTVNNKVLVSKRTGKGIWENLFEFYLFEGFKTLHWTPDFLDTWMHEQLGISNFTLVNISGIYKQKLTHQNLQGQFITIELKKVPKSLQHFLLVKKHDLSNLAFPRFINDFLKDKQLLKLD